jgi:hypothetical protein
MADSVPDGSDVSADSVNGPLSRPLELLAIRTARTEDKGIAE